MNDENLGILLQKFNTLLRGSEFPDSLLREIHNDINNDKVVDELKERIVTIQGELDHIINQIKPNNETSRPKEDHNQPTD